MIETIKATYLKNHIATKRAFPISFMWTRVFGGILSICFPIFIYYYVFFGNISLNFQATVATSDYITYIALGQSSQIIAFATLMNVGRCIIQEIYEGTLDTFLLSPASRMGYFLGCYIEQLGRSFVEFLAVFVFSILLGAKILLEQIPVFIICMFLLSIASFSISMLVSSIMVYTKDTFITQNTICTVMGLLCGIFFPIEFLPRGFYHISKLIPLTTALEIFRNCVLNNIMLAENFIKITYL